MTLTDFLIGAFACWRLTNMIYAPENGPFDLILHFRRFLCRWDMPRRMLECDLCCSVWVAGIVSLFYLGGLYIHPGFHWVIYIFAWSGAVCIIRIVMDMGWKVVNSYQSAKEN